jgi:hypothetical protein
MKRQNWSADVRRTTEVDENRSDSCAAPGVRRLGRDARFLPHRVHASTLTVPTGRPVSGAFVEVSGALIATISCSTGTDTTVCYVPGYAGKYNLEVGAAGFQRTQRSVTVQDTTPSCGCATVATEHLSVALVASP